jgi:glyoxylate reductase
VTRRLVEGDRLVRKGRFAGWSPTLLLVRSLEGKVLGVIGMGASAAPVACAARLPLP